MTRPGDPLGSPRPLIPWWPRPDAAAQTRLHRIPSRGPVRIALLVLLTLGWVSLTGSMVLATLGSVLLVTLSAAVVLATCTVLLLRAWAAGTYVNDEGFVIRRLLTTRSGRWPEVSGIDIGVRRTRIAIWGTSITTHLSPWSLDAVGSRQAYELATEEFMRWYLHQ